MKLLFLTILALAFAAPARAFDHGHAAWTRILAARVKGNTFDYAGLKPQRAPLDAYLSQLAAVPAAEFKGWNEKQRLAFLINLYNAATIRLVLDHQPVKSIKDIGGAKGPWKQPVVKALGKTHTLDEVEHQLIRGNFAEPRIHFAVNCASVGCPPLAATAYTADQLDRQLDAATRRFLADRSQNRVDAKRNELLLSPLFDWFRDDFAKKSGSPEKFVAPYFPATERDLIASGRLKTRHGEYDWKLNGR